MLLIEKHGPNGKVADLLRAISEDCLKRRTVDRSDQCGACCLDTITDAIARLRCARVPTPKRASR